MHYFTKTVSLVFNVTTCYITAILFIFHFILNVILETVNP